MVFGGVTSADLCTQDQPMSLLTPDLSFIDMGHLTAESRVRPEWRDIVAVAIAPQSPQETDPHHQPPLLSPVGTEGGWV